MKKSAKKPVDMAHACKISQANFSAIEKNRREVGPRIALKLAAKDRVE